MSQAANLSAMMSGTTLTVPNLTYTGTLTGVSQNLSGNLTANNIVSSNNVTYSGTLTGGTGIINIGSGQFYKDANGSFGIGTASPIYKLDISGTNPRIRLNETTGYVLTSYVNSAGTLDIGRDSSAGAVSGVAYAGFFDLAGAYPYVWRSNSTERMRLDSAGNLGLGVTPSAWGSGWTASQVRTSHFANISNNYTSIGYNAYESSGWKYINNGYAILYQQNSTAGAHSWAIAASGTAGNVITFGDPKMTLDASGNLYVGTTIAAMSSPKLDVSGSRATDGLVQFENNANTSDVNHGILNLINTATGAAGNDARIMFSFRQVGATTSLDPMASLGAIKEAGSFAAAIQFNTRSATGTYSEKLRIDSSGNLLLGTTAATYNYQTKNLVLSDGTSAGLQVTNGTTTIESVVNAGGAYFGTRTSSNLNFVIGDSTKMTLDTSGKLSLGGYPINSWDNTTYTATSFTYDAVNGVRYYWTKIANLGTEGSIIFEVSVKTDLNYMPYTLAVGVACTWNATGIHAKLDALNSYDVTVYIAVDNSNNVWLYAGAVWDSYMNWRVKDTNGTCTIYTSNFVQQYTLTGSSPAIPPGKQINGTYGAASSTTLSINSANYFGAVQTFGGATIGGALSKASGSFRIDHPLPALEETHQLVHSFIEGPQADLIYRGKVNLVDGSASINIDEASGMTEGTFVALCRDVQCFTTNESDWTPVKGSVSGNALTIQSQDSNATSSISWLVIGERHDKHMYETEWTDNDGKVIVEPLKQEDALETNQTTPYN